MTVPSQEASVLVEFLIARGGPFYALQSRLDLLHRHCGRL
jgi:hypothetical protein